MALPVALRHLLPAAFVLLTAAVFGVAQQSGKQNVRPQVEHGTTAQPSASAADAIKYSYEFTKPDFLINHIVVEHDASGRGKITFSRKNEETPIIEPLELSTAAITRIATLWQTLKFLDTAEGYQSERQYPHLGTMKLKMHLGERQRTAEFNWTNNQNASQLVNEYRRAADQAILVFDISVARESQPLNAPKLMQQLESLLTRSGLSDPKQLIPLLREVSIDEHLPLIARNHATRLLKKIDK